MKCTKEQGREVASFMLPAIWIQNFEIFVYYFSLFFALTTSMHTYPNVVST